MLGSYSTCQAAGAGCTLRTVFRMRVPATRCQGAEADPLGLACRTGGGYREVSRCRQMVEDAQARVDRGTRVHRRPRKNVPLYRGQLGIRDCYGFRETDAGHHHAGASGQISVSERPNIRSSTVCLRCAAERVPDAREDAGRCRRYGIVARASATQRRSAPVDPQIAQRRFPGHNSVSRAFASDAAFLHGREWAISVEMMPSLMLKIPYSSASATHQMRRNSCNRYLY
jgi:hypothetical protein